MEQVNRHLKSARAMKGLTQADLAKRIGRSQSWLSQIEQGTLQPSEVDQALICRTLRVTPDAIFPLLEGQIGGGKQVEEGRALNDEPHHTQT